VDYYYGPYGLPEAGLRQFHLIIIGSIWLTTLGCGLGGGGSSGDSGSSTPPPNPAPPVLPPQTEVDLDVDTDRDGIIENSAEDDTWEAVWSTNGGAVFYLNIDDDNNDGASDNEGSTVIGSEDEKDLARILLRKYESAPSDATVTIEISPASAQGNVRIFQKTGIFWNMVYVTGSSFSLPVTDIINGEIELGIEGINRQNSTWTGDIGLTLEIRENGGTLLGADTVRLRIAPLILVHNLMNVETVHVVDIGSSNSDFRNDLQTVAVEGGFLYYAVPGSSYQNDRWIQDSSERGFVLLPSNSGQRRRVDSVLQCARNRQIDNWGEEYLFGVDQDFHFEFGSNSYSINYGGNLEVVPPYTGYPWGRIVVGGGSSYTIGGSNWQNRHMDQAYREFFDASGIQGPYLEVSTEWLAVGHVDEHTSFVKAPSAPKGWIIALASPSFAKEILQDVQTSGGGSLPVFENRGSWETTVDQILADSALMTYNQEAQQRMDQIRSLYKTSLGLTDAEIIDVPVLFEDVGSEEAAAYNPGVANMLVLPDSSGTIHLVIPDPEGPHNPTDAWADATKSVLEAFGTPSQPIKFTFTDIFNAYHKNLGEAHCGTNTIRTPPSEEWWND
jgi:protein-arginine deiminase